jgi:hypothetical protein
LIFDNFINNYTIITVVLGVLSPKCTIFSGIRGAFTLMPGTAGLFLRYVLCFPSRILYKFGVHIWKLWGRFSVQNFIYRKSVFYIYFSWSDENRTKNVLFWGQDYDGTGHQELRYLTGKKLIKDDKIKQANLLYTLHSCIINTHHCSRTNCHYTVQCTTKHAKETATQRKNNTDRK